MVFRCLCKKKIKKNRNTALFPLLLGSYAFQDKIFQEHWEEDFAF